MANVPKKFKTGLALDPVSADPSNPVVGQQQYSDGTHRAEGVWVYKADSTWHEVGQAIGSLDVFYQQDCENDTVSTLSTGKGTGFDAGGTFNGALANETVSPIAGDQSFKYTTSATATNSTLDYIASPAITLDDKQKGNDIGISLYYTWDGSDDLVEVVIYDDTNNEKLNSSVDLLKAASNPTRYSASVFVPESCNTIKIGFHHTGTSESSKVLVWDDIELSTNPFVYKNLLNTEYMSTAGMSVTNFWDSTTGGEDEFDQSLVSGLSGSTILEVNNVSSQDRITAKSRCTVSGTVGVGNAGTDGGPQVYDSSGNLIAQTQNSGNDQGPSTKAFTILLEQGDYFYIALKSSIDDRTGGLSMTAQAETEHVVTPQKGTDSYIRLQGGNGHGSTNTKIRRFSTVYDDVGTDITYTDSATDGASFTANVPGIYHISYTDVSNVASNRMGLSLNSTQLTTDISSITSADILGYKQILNTDPASLEIGVTMYLRAGDVIRPHGSGDTTSTANQINFYMAKLGFQSLSAIPVQKTAYIKNVLGSGVVAQTASSGNQTIQLNTVEGDTTIVSFDDANDRFTLGAGEYEIEGWLSAYGINGACQSFIYDFTNSADFIVGMTASVTSSEGHSLPFGQKVTLTSSTTFELRGWTNNAAGNWGTSPASGRDICHASIKITKLR